MGSSAESKKTKPATTVGCSAPIVNRSSPPNECVVATPFGCLRSDFEWHNIIDFSLIARVAIGFPSFPKMYVTSFDLQRTAL